MVINEKPRPVSNFNVQITDENFTEFMEVMKIDKKSPEVNLEKYNEGYKEMLNTATSI